MTKQLLQEGDIIELKTGHNVYASIPEHFVYGNRRGSFTLVHSNVTIGGNFDYLAGQYVVYKTVFGGGGTGHGPHDVYPDGHHVYCEQLSGANPTHEVMHHKVDFYQSGCFTCMIEDIVPVGHAERRWVKPT